ncbi:CarD family transcriptional regulator [Acetonema longum]|uniref:CarD family transcriptional regulator n=1 Tax=Acetonema longum DSM 6540 TaxID=1009370 RepID=F7NGZ2_9FIRM|nr:CarD family transcriptional regulator [Acetonema longum]EGO64723.1 CarD family transcriptional regulator [Acetonema longum DSM 6540]
MFQTGDNVFYPVHGAGIVEAVEEKEIAGQSQVYYVVNILHKNMQVMVPITRAENLRMRRVVDPDELDSVLGTFHDGETDTTISDNQRHRANMNKLKSGNIHDGIEVIRDLMRLNSKKKLGAAEKTMLDNARQILISEMQLVKGIPHEQAVSLLDQVINA